MSGYGGFQFASPSQFGDWAQYAGLNRATGEVEESRPQQGVKPPENMQDYMKQRLAPVEGKIAAVMPAMMQAAQGNIVQSIGTMRNAQTQPIPGQPSQPSQPSAGQVDTGYDYTVGL